MRKELRKKLALPAVLFTMAAQSLFMPANNAAADEKTPGKLVERGINVLFGTKTNSSLWATGAGIITDVFADRADKKENPDTKDTEKGQRKYDDPDDEIGYFPDEDDGLENEAAPQKSPPKSHLKHLSP